MPAIERTITVETPIDAVWSFLSDFTTTETWDPPTLSTTRVSGDGGVGTVYKNVSRFFGRTTETMYTVVASEPWRIFQLEGRATGMKTLDTMTFVADDARSTLTYRAEFQPQGVAKLALPVLPLVLRKLGNDAEKSLRSALSGL